MVEIDVEYMPIWRRYLKKIRDGGLSNSDLGALFRAMMEYQFEGREPENLSGAVGLFWVFFRDDLDYSRKRYETSVINGRKGGRKKKKKPEETQQNLEEGITITESESISKSISKTQRKQDQASSSSEAEEDLCISKKTYGEYGWVLLSDHEYEQLKQTMGEAELKQCIAYIDESAQSTGNRNHWVDWKTVVLRCHQKSWAVSPRRYPQKKEIPKGASGELGPIELDAIHRLLREG